MDKQSISAVIDRHEKIALQLSGGKDSLACLYLLKDHWPKIKAYNLNTGSQFPETAEIIDNLRAEGVDIVEIASNQPEVVREYGLPSDIVPVESTPFAIVAGSSNALIQDRYSCCIRTIMMPMHQRMIEDGVTLIIRGQRADDTHKAPIKSGHIEDGIEYLFPIEDWSSRDVMEFLKAEKVKLPRFYEILDEAPDCMTCSAWWEKGVAKYLKRYHNDAYIEVQKRLETINLAVSNHIASFNKEVS